MTSLIPAEAVQAIVTAVDTETAACQLATPFGDEVMLNAIHNAIQI